ncbi:Ubiquitin-activating enzyme E1-like [Penicillium angulare]|uniref:Ubiquitin-activating enzyme E1-like n=1 Tax=Penicillium angulare TaxID=116970 RepID=UPI00254051B6|nr:Ubiquitin-activating enzyme E1-like [Penicillium angulare]KAJ5256884.1 Ubiquitin-activating enzyme E1-like [Penicillium angulare]
MPGSSIKRSLGVELTRTIQESRVLLVGAGGIGCELLKNLVLTGFGEIHIIDLDTIDLSNLNRQFLFRHEHIKKPKALVAKEVAHKFQPKAKLEAYHANIMDKQFDVHWFQSFTIVFNALDNLAARRHVNHMCLAASVPLIESGTTGFNGQVQVIEKGKTECYDCNPKEVQRSFPICTVRSSPTQPIHCIVWGKSYLLPELFGESEDNPAVFDTSENADNEHEIAELQREKEDLKEIRESMGSDDFSYKVFDKVFRKDIERLSGLKDMWKEREPPTALSWDQLLEQSSSLDSKTIAKFDQRPWSQPEAFIMFKESLDLLSKRFQVLQTNRAPEDSMPILEFDKDDEDTLDFVTATAILRSAIFNIEPKSKFDTKQMAGNIIPAIATTNAMTAGLCVLQSFKVLQGALSNAMVFLEKSGVRAINTEPLNPPKEDCTVCSAATGYVIVDKNSATLNNIVEDVLRLELGYGEEISILKDSALIYDPELEENLSKKLSELGFTNGTSITVVDEDDEDQDPRANLELFIIERTESATGDEKPASLKNTLTISRKPKPNQQSPPEEENGSANGVVNPAKRKREGEDEDLTNGHVAKKIAGEPPSNTSGNNGVIVIDDDEGAEGKGEGAILIDD